MFNYSKAVLGMTVVTTLLTVGISSKAYSRNTKPYLCMRHTRISDISGNKVDSGWICSKVGKSSKWISLGDDTGWKSQLLSFKTNSNTTVCLYHSRVSPILGEFKDEKCGSYDNVRSVFLGDDTGWKNQLLGFTIYSPKKNYE